MLPAHSDRFLSTFEAHGFEMEGETGPEVYGTCPLTGKRKKFYINPAKRLWHSKTTGLGGTVADFLALVQKEYAASLRPSLVEQLADDRGLPPEAFAAFDLGWDGKAYTLGVRDRSAHIVDIRRYDLSSSQRRMLSTPGCHVGLLGAELIDASPQADIDVTEGEWDAVALYWLRRKVRQPGVVLAMPGAGIFKPEWVPWLAGRRVRAFLDHDDAGRQGDVLLTKRLRGRVASLEFLHWPGTKRDGYDMRDFIGSRAVRRNKPRSCFAILNSWLRPEPRIEAGAALPTPDGVTEFDERLAACTTPDEAVAILNERHFIIRVGSRYVAGDERPGEPVRLLPFEEFRKRYMTFSFPTADGKRQIMLGTVYFRHPARRLFDGDLVCRPPGSSVPARSIDYNIWRGLAVQPKPGDWSLFRDHIFSNICRADQQHFDYLINWMALGAQQPGRLPGVAVVLIGREGTGKSAFFHWYSELFPVEHTLQITSPRHLVGHFNALLSGRIAVLADEAVLPADEGAVGMLHALVTERRRIVERKGIDPYEEDNCVHLVIASNHESVVRASREARRYFVLRMSDKRMQDTAYFSAIAEQQAAGGKEAMLHDLLSRDLSGFDPFEFPRTEALREQIDWSRKPHEAWLKELLAETTPQAWEAIHSKEDLYDRYKRWVVEMRRGQPVTLSQLCKYFVQVFGREVLIRKRFAGAQFRRLQFPPLDECRQRFDPLERWPETEERKPRLTLRTKRRSPFGRPGRGS
jgi:hypothetical protein